MSNKNNLSYLDCASTSKIDPSVYNAMAPFFLELYGNPSSSHDFGNKSKNAIEEARSQIANQINAEREGIIFTSGSTEAINYAIKGYAYNTNRGSHIITIKTEHKAVLKTCEFLEGQGFEVTYLDVDENGLIALDQLRESIQENTCLIAAMYVNNETGVIQPINAIGAIAKEENIAFFCDATQAVGKIDIDVEKDNIDMLCFSGHKLNGPKGIGVLYKKRNIELVPLFHGGGQETGNRAGTYNTPLIVGLAKACELSILSAPETTNKVLNLTASLKQSLSEITTFKEVSGVSFKVPHILNIIIPGLDSNQFIDKHKNLAISNGSACNAGLFEDSHVLSAMLNSKIYNNNNLRISMDKFSQKEDVEILIHSLKDHLNS